MWWRREGRDQTRSREDERKEGTKLGAWGGLQIIDECLKHSSVSWHFRLDQLTVSSGLFKSHYESINRLMNLLGLDGLMIDGLTGTVFKVESSF